MQDGWIYHHKDALKVLPVAEKDQHLHISLGTQGQFVSDRGRREKYE